MSRRMETSMGDVEIVGATTLYGDHVLVGFTRYATDDRIAVLAVMESGEVYGKLSVNVAEAVLAPGEFVVSHDIPPADARRLLTCDAGITNTGRRQKYGFCDQPIYLLTMPS